MLDAIKKHMVKTLSLKSVVNASDWAEKYRIMGQPFPGKWSFKNHPWAREMHDAKDEYVVSQKAAQMGVTETALNKTFKAIDVDCSNVLYILPSAQPDAHNFMTSRFDPALELSPHLKNLFSDVSNIGHKRAGAANLFIASSKSPSQLKSNPCPLVIGDEVDEMDINNLKLAFERTSGHVHFQIFLLSTPTIKEQGINNFFLQSSQDHFVFQCPHCSKWTELIFPESLIILGESYDDPSYRDSYLICKECKHKLEHEDKVNFLKTGKWVKTKDNMPYRGFYINQLYSIVRPPRDLALAFHQSKHDPAVEQEFYNSKLGMPHSVAGAQVLPEQITACIGNYTQLEAMKGDSFRKGFVCMGIDVGKVIHYEITQYIVDKDGPDLNLKTVARVLKAGSVSLFEELDMLMTSYNVCSCVIDADPETRKSYEFASRFFGRVRTCRYRAGIVGKLIQPSNSEEFGVTVDRTSWLDVSLGRFKHGRIYLPQDISLEYRNHIQAPVRIYKEDNSGNMIGRYSNGSSADHLAHARNYCELALRLVGGVGVSKDVTKVY